MSSKNKNAPAKWENKKQHCQKIRRKKNIVIFNINKHDKT